MTDHRPPHDDLPLFAHRPEPTPTPEKFRREPGAPRDYAREWSAFVEANPTVADRVLWEALVDLRAGVERIAVALIFERIRRDLRVSINTSYAAAASDWLIAQEPRLATLIERRRRKVTR